jgi:hypothetical protein
MKNKLFFAGMAALALTFGLVMTGCDNSGGGGGGSGGVVSGTTNGRLDISGIPPEYNGYYALAMSGDLSADPNTDTRLIGALSIESYPEEDQYTILQIRNGKVTLPVYLVEKKGSRTSIKSYNGNENVVMGIMIRNVNVELIAIGVSDVKFDNGKGTMSSPTFKPYVPSQYSQGWQSTLTLPW